MCGQPFAHLICYWRYGSTSAVSQLMIQFIHKPGNLHVNRVAFVLLLSLLKMHVVFPVVALKIVSVTV